MAAQRILLVDDVLQMARAGYQTFASVQGDRVLLPGLVLHGADGRSGGVRVR